MRFQYKDGYDSEFLGCTICPIIETAEDETSQLCGTGFYISPQGLALSATHNFRERDSGIFSKIEKVEHVHSVTFARLFYNSNNTIDLIFNPITQVIYREGFDIAIVFSGIGKRPPKLLSITSYIPKIGEEVYAYSYPNKPGFTNNIGTKMNLEKAEYEGIITAHFPTGRDRILLPGPCLEARMAAPGGTSGGPVFNNKGHVFGVISTSLDGDPSITYISPFRSVLDFDFEVNTDKGLISASLRKLAKLKKIILYDN